MYTKYRFEQSSKQMTYHPWKFKVEPQHEGLEDDFPFQKVFFQVPYWFLGGVRIFLLVLVLSRQIDRLNIIIGQVGGVGCAKQLALCSLSNTHCSSYSKVLSIAF